MQPPLALAALYWLTPAGELPAFLPGFREGATEIHVKNALGALIIGLAALQSAGKMRDHIFRD